MSTRGFKYSDYICEPPSETSSSPPLISVCVLQPLGFLDIADCLVTPTRTPLAKKYMRESERLRSFDSELFVCEKSAEELSQYGFYWAGPWVEPGIAILDHVRCFWCKCNLIQWLESDSIAGEHMRVRPDCPFARATIGREPSEAEKNVALQLWKKTERVKYLQRHGVPMYQIEAALSDIYDNKYPFPDCEGLITAVGRALERSVSAAKPEGRVDTCKICLTNQVTVLFIPCGHLISCLPCSPSFNKCPLCREKIRARVLARLT